MLEGVAFGLRDSLDLAARARRRRPARGRVSGGGARSELWLRIIASVLELPLERPVVEEGAAYGAALLGGVAGGVWPDTGRPSPRASGCAARSSPEPTWVDALRRGARALPRALPRYTQRLTAPRYDGQGVGPAVPGATHRSVRDGGAPRRITSRTCLPTNP